MPHVVEVGSEIQIDDAGLALKNSLTNSLYRIVRRFLRAIAERSRLKVRFEDRLQDELQRTLNDSRLSPATSSSNRPTSATNPLWKSIKPSF